MVKFMEISSGSVRARLARRLALCFLLLMLSGATWVLYCEHQNLRDAPFPTDAELRLSLSRAAAWVLNNRNSISNENNPMLWLFVRDAGRLSNDPRLASLAEQYQARYTRGTISQFFFDAAGIDRVRDVEVDLPDSWQGYQRLFVYGATCNLSMRSDPQVLTLLSPSACESGHAWLRFPWCRTHQLMGLRFVQRNRCEHRRSIHSPEGSLSLARCASTDPSPHKSAAFPTAPAEAGACASQTTVRHIAT